MAKNKLFLLEAALCEAYPKFLENQMNVAAGLGQACSALNAVVELAETRQRRSTLAAIVRILRSTITRSTDKLNLNKLNLSLIDERAAVTLVGACGRIGGPESQLLEDAWRIVQRRWESDSEIIPARVRRAYKKVKSREGSRSPINPNGAYGDRISSSDRLTKE